MLRRLLHFLKTASSRPDDHRDVAEALWKNFIDLEQDGIRPLDTEDPAMVKLYRRDGTSGVLAYHEAWFAPDEVVVVEHKGLVGSKGETIRHPRDPNLTPAEQVKRLLKPARDAGYAELDHYDHSFLVVEYKAKGWGSAEDAEKLNDLRGELDEILGWSGLGHCDGGSVGSGTMEAACLVVDFEAARKAITEGLKETPFAEFNRIYEET